MDDWINLRRIVESCCQSRQRFYELCLADDTTSKGQMARAKANYLNAKKALEFVNEMFPKPVGYNPWEG